MTTKPHRTERPCPYPECGFTVPADSAEWPMCPAHRAEWDAIASEEAWRLAEKVLRPWVETTRAIGSDELTEVMEGALVRVEAEIASARRAIEEARVAL